jgi:hypothetical protein
LFFSAKYALLKPQTSRADGLFALVCFNYRADPFRGGNSVSAEDDGSGLLKD